MKRNNKPLSPAEHAKQLGISQEQFELQARKQAKEFFRKKGLLGPELTPSEKLELERTAKIAHKAFENNFPKNPDWPPFPLPDIYDNDDPELIGAAYDAIGWVLRNYIPDVGFFGMQLEAAIEVARDIRLEYPKLRDIPLPKNLNWPTKQDFIRLEQWFLDAQTFVKAELCERAAQGKPAEPEQKIEPQEKGGQSKTNITDYKALNLAKVPISRLIEQGESHTLEFKEIPECNTQQNRKNNDVLFPPLKTISGFLNAEGGILLIGVDNSGKIVGIEPYLNTMEQGNNDTFEQQIRNCLRDRFEPYPIGKVKVSFEKFMEGTVCRIDVQAVKEPVNLDNEVYVRDGNTTQLLKGRRLTDWIQQRRLLTALPSGK